MPLILETTYTGLETAHMSHIFALNDGCALHIIVRTIALSSFMSFSIEAVASVKKALNLKL